MTTDELEAHLDGQAETQNLDFKSSCPWDVKRFAKDILAFSNVRDGGLIIVGVVDGTFAREGISDEHRATYKIDVMRDQMTSYADPHTNFSIEFPADRNGLVYGAIRIEPFDSVPTICRRDSHDTQAGAIYYRNLNRRMESAHISNYHDMRELIETATVHMMRRMQKQGFGPAVEVQQAQDAKVAYEKELGGL
jgi:predicted HTH transcriptional regulator